MIAIKSFTPRTWPVPDLETIEGIGLAGEGLADLWEASPVRFETPEPASEQIIDALFPHDSLLCCGWNFFRCQTKPRKHWRGLLSSMQFIVPSSMKAVKGKTSGGKMSSRSLENVDARRFLIVEFDFREKNKDGTDNRFSDLLRTLSIDGLAAEDLCAGLLLSLAQKAPLVLVAHSGGKSLHGWFYCLGQPEEKLWQFMSHAVSLGADRATWTTCQLVRMPDGLRDDGTRQRVYFFNPECVR